MNFPKSTLFLFLGGILLMGWLLYPRELFLAFMEGGKGEALESEAYYLSYLKKHPHHKKAVMGLNQVYQRMGEPEKATPFLRDLFIHRTYDWDAAKLYLENLEERAQDQELHRARVMMLKRMMETKDVPRSILEENLHQAYLEARWNQNEREAYSHLSNLIRYAKDPKEYVALANEMNLGMQREKEISFLLQERLNANPLDVFARQELASVWILMGKVEEALGLLEKGERLIPQELGFLKQKIAILENKGRWDAASRALAVLIQFPQVLRDEKLVYQRQLAYDYQRSAQFEEAKKLFETLVDLNAKDQPSWEGLLSLYDQMGSYYLLKGALIKYLTYFPSDLKRRDQLTDLLLFRLKDISNLNYFWAEAMRKKEKKLILDVGYLLQENARLSDALAWYEKGLGFFKPGQELAELTLSMGEISKKLGRTDQALAWYLRSWGQSPRKEETLLALGQELSYFKHPLEALQAFEVILAQNPNHGLGLYLHSDLERAQGNNKKAEEEAKQAWDILRVKKNLDLPEKLALLKLKERFEERANLSPEYVNLAQRFPQNREILLSHIDYLLAQGKLKSAEQNISNFQKLFPKDLKFLEPFKPRVAYLHRQKDLQVGSKGRLVDFGSDRITQWEVNLRIPVRDQFFVKGDFNWGHYESPSTQEDDWVPQAGVSLEWRPSRFWLVEPGLKAAVSGERKTVSPFAQIDYYPLYNWSLGFEGQWGEFSAATPREVQAGGLKDGLEGHTYAILAEKVRLSGFFNFERERLKDGSYGLIKNGAGELSYVLFKKPDLAIGYQFSYYDLDAHGNFLTLVPLLNRSLLHSLTLRGSYEVPEKANFYAGFFLSEDTTRNLHFFEGDLWGGELGLEWFWGEGWSFMARYAYGQESLSGISGRTHEVNGGVQFHWH